MAKEHKYCFSKCEFFRCGQKALLFKGKVAWCKFADDECNIQNCKYAQCMKGRLLPNGVCGFSIKVKSHSVKPEEIVEPIKISGKLAQKLREKELF
jgi:hypothetical protein